MRDMRETEREKLVSKGANEEEWDKLSNFLDENHFTVADMFAVACATLLREQESNFVTTIMVGGQKFMINVEKKR